MRTSLATIVLLLATAGAAKAEMQIQREGPQVWPSRHALSAHLGYQTGMGGNIANPPGFKVFLDYAYRVHPKIWFNLQLNQVFGLGGGGNCIDQYGSAFNCPNRGGSATEIVGGVKFKWNIPTVPVVVEVPIGVGVAIMYDRGCGDGGAAPMIRPGTKVHYFITKNIGVGAGFNFSMGPGIHGGGRCGAGYTDFYGSFDVLAGAQFVLN